MRKARKGDAVIVHFSDMMENGAILDAPRKSTIGDGSTFPAVEKAVVGLLTGETAGKKAPPENVSGRYRRDRLKEIPGCETPEACGMHVGRWTTGHMSRDPSAGMRKRAIGEVAGCPSCPM